MGKVKRGQKWIDGFWGERYTWICVECGREWKSQGLARDCEHQNHYHNIYTDEDYNCINIADYPKEKLIDQDGEVSYR